MLCSLVSGYQYLEQIPHFDYINPEDGSDNFLRNASYNNRTTGRHNSEEQSHNLKLWFFIVMGYIV
jgi:hypothetical protein